jgi:hypothetical protein
MNAEFQKDCKIKDPNWFQGKVQNGILVMPNLFRHLI